MPSDPRGDELAERQLILIEKLKDTQTLTVKDVEEAVDIIQECLKLAATQAEIVTLLAYLILLGGDVCPRQMAKGDAENGTLDEWISVYNVIESTLIVYAQVFDSLN